MDITIWMIEHFANLLISVLVVIFGSITTTIGIANKNQQKVSEQNANLRDAMHRKEHEQIKSILIDQSEELMITAKCSVAALEAHVEKGANGEVQKTLKEFRDRYFENKRIDL